MILLRNVFLLFVLLAAHPLQAGADAGDAYRQAMMLAGQGREAEAVAMLAGAAETSPDIWRERMQTAATLLSMRVARRTDLSGMPGLNAALISDYAQMHAAPHAADGRTAGIIAAVFPGAGHAWLGRWHDAGIAALMVWPMLLLTLWAWRRGEGPLTVFLALLTLWLWSGSVFSAISLAGRGNLESYAVWWQGMWQASGLPGRPW